MDTLLVFLLSDALDLEVVLSTSTGNVLPVGLHFLIGTTLELVILVKGHFSPRVNFLPVGLH